MVNASALDNLDQSSFVAGNIPLLASSNTVTKFDEKTADVSVNNFKNKVQMNGKSSHQSPQQRQQQKYDNSNDISNKLPAAVMPRSNSRVILTGFRSPNRCFVRSIEADIDAAYNCIINMVDGLAKKSRVLTEIPKPNSYCLANQKGIFYRAQIIKAADKKRIRLSLVDFGTTLVRPLNELRQATDEILALPRYAFNIQLSKVDNFALNDDLTNFLSKFEDQEFEIRYDARLKQSLDNVELFHCDSIKSLNDEIINYCIKTNVSAFDAAKDVKNNNNSNSSLDTNKSTPSSTTTQQSKIKHSKSTKNPIESTTSQFNQMNFKDIEKNNSSPLAASNSSLSKSPSSSIVSSNNHPPKQIKKPVMIPVSMK